MPAATRPLASRATSSANWDAVTSRQPLVARVEKTTLSGTAWALMTTVWARLPSVVGATTGATTLSRTCWDTAGSSGGSGAMIGPLGGYRRGMRVVDRTSRTSRSGAYPAL